MTYAFQNVAELLHELPYQFKHFATPTSPRGKQTVELMPFVFEILDPRDRLAYHPDRRFSLTFAIAEAMSLWNWSPKLADVARYAPAMEKFSDDGSTLYGAYGPRFTTSMLGAIDRLKSDSNTRQAVVPIYKAADTFAMSKDIPCTLTLHFAIRDDKLRCHAHMRSNDIWTGVPYDVFQFTLAQEIMANTLGIDVGPYTHSAYSFHMYEENRAQIDELYPGMIPVRMDPIPYTVVDAAIAYPAFHAALVEDDWYAPDTDMITDVVGDLVKHDGPFEPIMYNENLHRTESVTTLEDWQKVPEWSRPFTKRWKKECYE